MYATRQPIHEDVSSLRQIHAYDMTKVRRTQAVVLRECISLADDAVDALEIDNIEPEIALARIKNLRDRLRQRLAEHN